MEDQQKQINLDSAIHTNAGDEATSICNVYESSPASRPPVVMGRVGMIMGQEDY